MPRQLEDFECPTATIYRQQFIDLGLTVTDVAKGMGLSANHLSLVICGKRRLCKKMENQIKKFLSIHKKELLFYTDMVI